MALKHIEQSNDGTTKLIFDDGYHAVLIPQKNGKRTLCVSSQVGCAMGCEFCLTAKMGFMRNLTSEEIAEQFEEALIHLKAEEVITRERKKSPLGYAHEHITSMVYMGMGEPLNNYPNVEQSIEFLHEKYSYPYKKITVSTSGIIPTMKKFIERDWKVHLALSFHSPFQDKRDYLMPYLSKWKIPELVELCNQYSNKFRTKIMIEYIMIKGLTDRDEDLQELLKLNFVNMTNFNLIPLNGHMDLHGERYYSSSDETCNAFRLTLMDAGFKCFTRKNMGEDIEAACGMLNSPEENSATKNSE
jgi:23S rRNA (adenine2503-C2)-methyltransferase